MCLLTDNYAYLNIVAHRITKDDSLANDLISDTYINLHNKNIPREPDQFIKYFSKSMKNCFLNKKRKYDPLVLIEIDNYIEQHRESDEWKYKQIEEFKLTLPTHEQILFELCFEKDLSHREVSEMLTTIGKYKVNYKCIERLVKPIRTKLKQWKWKQQEL